MKNNPTEIKTAYIYCRVSTDRQEYSNDNQIRACSEYAKNNEYDIVNTFVEDGKSGTTTDRPEFQSMLSAIDEHPVSAIITYKIDRFARNVSDFSNIRKGFKKNGIKLLSVSEGGDVTEGLIGNIFASVAEWESEVIGQRTSDGMAQKFRSGWWPSYPPLGYKVKEMEDKKKIVIPDPKTAIPIKKAFDLYSTNDYSILRLIQLMHEQGFRTKAGNPIAHTTMHNILRNKFYIGIMKWNGEEKKGKHKALVSEKIFNTCQLIAAKHRNFVIRKRKYDFLLRGVIVCAKCGQRYVAEWHNINSSKRDKIAYYHCSKLVRCKSKYAEVKDLEKKVADHLQNIKFSKGFTDVVIRRVERYLKCKDKEIFEQRNRIHRQHSILNQKRSILEKRLMDDTIDRETFKRIHTQLQSDMKNSDRQLFEVENSRNFDFPVLEEVLALTRNIPKAYSQAPDFLKRKYLRFFFEKILVHDKNIDTAVYSPLIQELISQKEIILRSAWLAKWDDYRKADWSEIIDCPSLFLEQTNQLLSI